MGAKANLRYHVVLVTKYRKPALRGVEDHVYAAMRHVEAHSSIHIEEMGVEDGNHIHLVIRCKPTYSLAQIVNRFKTMSQHHLWEHQPAHLRRWYWGTRHKLWSGGYYAGTVGDVALDKVLDYVRKQHPKTSKTRTPPS